MIVTQQASLYPPDLFESTAGLTGLALDRVWWAVYTKSRQEKVFSQHLLVNQIPHYLPLVQKTYISCGRKFSARVPLFPGYVFMFGHGAGTRLAASRRTGSRGSFPCTTRFACGRSWSNFFA